MSEQMQPLHPHQLWLVKADINYNGVERLNDVDQDWVMALNSAGNAKFGERPSPPTRDEIQRQQNLNHIAAFVGHGACVTFRQRLIFKAAFDDLASISYLGDKLGMQEVIGQSEGLQAILQSEQSKRYQSEVDNAVSVLRALNGSDQELRIANFGHKGKSAHMARLVGFTTVAKASDSLVSYPIVEGRDGRQGLMPTTMQFGWLYHRQPARKPARTVR